MSVSLNFPENIAKKILVNGYSLKPDENILRTQMDSGLARQRRIFTQTPSVFNISLLLTDSEFQTFQGWYFHFGREGAAQFNIDLKSGTGIVSHIARFLGQPTQDLISQNLWQVKARLEVINPPTVSKDYLRISLNNDIDALYAGVDRYSQITNNHATQTSQAGQ